MPKPKHRLDQHVPQARALTPRHALYSATVQISGNPIYPVEIQAQALAEMYEFLLQHQAREVRVEARHLPPPSERPQPAWQPGDTSTEWLLFATINWRRVRALYDKATHLKRTLMPATLARQQQPLLHNRRVY